MKIGDLYHIIKNSYLRIVDFDEVGDPICIEPYGTYKLRWHKRADGRICLYKEDLEEFTKVEAISINNSNRR